MSSKTTFFVDIGGGANELPSFLQSLGLRVERHLDHFLPDADDGVWIPEVSRRQWVIITPDKKIIRDNRRIARDSRARLFILSCRMGIDSWRPVIRTNLQTVLILATHAPGPFGAFMGAQQLRFRWFGSDEAFSELTGMHVRAEPQAEQDN